jgi:hypothetical protein
MEAVVWERVVDTLNTAGLQCYKLVPAQKKATTTRDVSESNWEFLEETELDFHVRAARRLRNRAAQQRPS